MQETYAILPDVHVPFHNEALLTKVLKSLRTLKLTGVILNGDFLDLFSLSRYVEGSLNSLKDINLSYEYAQGNKVLDAIDSAVGSKVKKHYMYGNHEARYFKTLDSKDNAKYGNELRSPEEALQLVKRKYNVLTDWENDSIILGKNTEVIHGIYISTHTAKKHYDMFQNSTVIFGHTHRIQSVTTNNRGSYNIGCLADIFSKGFNYRNRVDKQLWSNGFAIVTVNNNGDSFVNTIPIVNNRFILNGVIY